MGKVLRKRRIRKYEERDNPTCYYCGVLLTKDCSDREDDHFPIPKAAGGKETVPICISCHNMKDRYPLVEWSWEWLSKVFEDLPKFSREAKFFLVMSMPAVGVHANQPVETALIDDRESKTCFYCGGLVNEDCEYDHLPLFGELGGPKPLPCCNNCHRMRNRYTVGEWPVEWISKVIEDFSKFSRETKLFWAKLMRVYAERQQLSKNGR